MKHKTISWDFMLQPNADKWIILKSQFATSRWGGTRKLPYAFTELETWLYQHDSVTTANTVCYLL